MRRWLPGWPFVEFSELQLAYERGDALATQWRIVRSHPSELYREVVELASGDPTVSRFFPGLGHNFLFMPNAFDFRSSRRWRFRHRGGFGSGHLMPPSPSVRGTPHRDRPRSRTC